MNPRTPSMDRRGFACAFWSVSGPSTLEVCAKSSLFTNWLAAVCSAGNRAKAVILTGAAFWGQIDVKVADFPFYLRAKTLDSGVIKTQKRGLAVCVNQSFFLPQWPLSALLAAFKMALATTRTRPLITPLCAPLVEPQQGPLSLTQLAAAKPKARLSVRWWAAFLAAFQARHSATNSGLTPARKRGVTNQSRPFGVVPRVAFLHFRADGAFPKRGCHV